MVLKFENIDELNEYYYGLLTNLSINSQYFSDKVVKSIESNIFDAYNNSYKSLTVNDDFLTKYELKEMKYTRKDFLLNYKMAKKRFKKEVSFKKKAENKKLKVFIKKRKRQIRLKNKQERRERRKEFFAKIKSLFKRR